MKIVQNINEASVFFNKNICQNTMNEQKIDGNYKFHFKKFSNMYILEVYDNIVFVGYVKVDNFKSSSNNITISCEYKDVENNGCEKIKHDV